MEYTEKIYQEIQKEIEEAKQLGTKEETGREMTFFGSPIFTIVCCS